MGLKVVVKVALNNAAIAAPVLRHRPNSNRTHLHPEGGLIPNPSLRLANDGRGR